MSAYLISNVRILDGTGREPFPGAVRVEADRIAVVTEGTMMPSSEGRRRSTGRERP
jgi:N-acyl-D-aspartate/D-glutamate deacylase